jgi:hypothetical protein
MIKEFSNKLLFQLEKELEQVNAEKNPSHVKLSHSLKLVRDALQKLRVAVNDKSFNSEEEEIFFFKYIKPGFYCWQIYYTELYNLENNIPFDADKQALYLEQELHFINRFFQHNQFLYQYYKVDAHDLDIIYFRRGAEASSLLLPNVPDLDPDFSTSSDYLFSKFKAYERLKDWIIEKILYFKKNPHNLYQEKNKNEENELTWTGDTINLVEIGMAIYHTGQVNGGSASLNGIFRWLEEKFNVSVGIPAKRFAEIRKRKRLSRTKYIDEMRDSIIRKLDKDDEYDPTNSGFINRR